MLIPRQGLNSSHFPKFERSQTNANSNLPDKSRLTNTNRTEIQIKTEKNQTSNTTKSQTQIRYMKFVSLGRQKA